MSYPKIPLSFYRQGDVLRISRELIGKVLCTNIDNSLAAGIITETEAYSGTDDRASHAYGGRRTDRTETMYQPGGVAYVYLCYGIHHLFNVVTNKKGKADAVLIRAIKPIEGIDTMLDRRNFDTLKPALTAGPGRLTQALGITIDYDAQSLNTDIIWIENRNNRIKPDHISSGPRIGVDYAEEDAELPWRFFLSESSWVS
ncbi:DNA-3-methyladenine glycosylase [Aliifodinibius salicampi]|uniref:Putative 3-methyladenine DNA glycosylase n=1 Tax=Fodinibius salicampi TaxID=1920655 RepID=A0ABT3PZ64_9BACT|nr:DNA-3-methyladenine glycosylase [Fodinibius salicampi]MCW9713121.1 DNA-3-methyladenine glycosylase [Fodinibius salicampi]